ncbi:MULTISPECIES: magnesium transporter CorA family protein [Bacillus]|uniref:magnesium transporter CorA family protein n=1 Tax=Bacillus TaxID=1386 RepID=UPI000BECF8FD|nr:magnesium transporter CorA family protein [Bacillus thuringiensis]EKS8366049.1 magnesium transporter CorA family protein [Bacillus cereus]EKS8372633.1 magnesium transporter CorA family protein [Bacillus cereus]MBG9486607.1 magnesium transporter [Bacillus thuringiensis]MBG9486634.1 magnesium transporter [Bacillus thuringiensis]MBG9486650.1 magnesium transporter [Bacillus thuringiensis]
MKCLHTSKWNWYHARSSELEQLSVTFSSDILSYFSKFVEEIHSPCENRVFVQMIPPSQPCVYGSLLYEQNQEDATIQKSLHYFVTNEILITVEQEKEEDLPAIIHACSLRITDCKCSAEGFCTLLSAYMSHYLQEVDCFEKHFRSILWNFYHHNNISVLENIYHIRHELFMSTHAFRLIQEVLQSVEEAWLGNVTQTSRYQQTHIKLQRGLLLTKEYQQELDTMIHLQEVVSSHRGNEIMKALTVLTAVSTPLTALGALWGMNFKHMPELEWQYGYVLALLAIILTTGGMYFYMRFKEWTGDLLRVKKKKSFFKSD